MAGRLPLHLTLLAFAAALSLQARAAASNWPAGTPPGQPPVVAATPVDEVPPAPTLAREDAIRSSQAAIGRSVAGHTLLDRDGRPAPLSRYRGKPLLVSFIYTGCFQVCPTQTRALHEAVKGLDVMLGPQQFNVVSIGFNQPFDAPDAMRSFARQHRIDYANWEFLAPPREQVEALTQAFGFSFVATPAGFDHVLGVTVVAPDGRIHSQVYGDRLRANQLGAPLRQLILGAPPPSQASTLSTLVERVRILCTVYDPDTGEYRYDYKLIFELIGGAIFFFSVLVYLLLEWRDQRRARKQQRCTQQPAPAPSA